MVMDSTILICIPTYHGPIGWLDRAVDSVKRQVYDNFECWIVKDGCGHGLRLWDESTNWRACVSCEDCQYRMEYLHALCKHDNRFKAFTLPVNFGYAGIGPRNFVLLNTDHEHIAYLDDDNWWEPNHLELLYSTLKSEDFDFVFTGTNVYNSEGNHLEVRNNVNCIEFGQIDTSEILHKRHLLKNFGSWRVPIGSPLAGAGTDWDLVRRWVYGGAKWAHTGQITMNYTKRDIKARSEQPEPIYYFSK
jgi:glycosyltransferase involved in cell wall biosynthesis